MPAACQISMGAILVMCVFRNTLNHFLESIPMQLRSVTPPMCDQLELVTNLGFSPFAEELKRDTLPVAEDDEAAALLVGRAEELYTAPLVFHGTVLLLLLISSGPPRNRRCFSTFGSSVLTANCTSEGSSTPVFLSCNLYLPSINLLTTS